MPPRHPDLPRVTLDLLVHRRRDAVGCLPDGFLPGGHPMVAPHLRQRLDRRAAGGGGPGLTALLHDPRRQQLAHVVDRDPERMQPARHDETPQ